VRLGGGADTRAETVDGEVRWGLYYAFRSSKFARPTEHLKCISVRRACRVSAVWCGAEGQDDG
jgi:hypothetical protein